MINLKSNKLVKNLMKKNPLKNQEKLIWMIIINTLLGKKLVGRCFVSLVKLSYWFKFHINIITGSGIMTISFYKGLTRNLEIWSNHVWVLPNIWRLGQDGNTKFDRNVSSKMLLNTVKCQGCSFCRFWVIERKPTVG